MGVLKPSGKWDQEAHHTRTSFLRVCRAWFDVISNSPQLWAYLTSGYGTRSLKEATRVIQLSQSSPLDIHFSPSQDVDYVKSWISLIGSEIHRWERVTVNVDLHTVPVEVWTGRSAPLLAVFKMSHSPGEVENPQTRTVILDLFNGDAPRLRTLDLSRISLRNWFPSFLCNLRTLVLGHIQSNGPTLAHLVGMLEMTAELETLELESIHFGEEGVNTSRKVYLRQLTSLSLTNLNTQYLIRLVKLLRIPACCCYYLEPALRGGRRLSEAEATVLLGALDEVSGTRFRNHVSSASSIVHLQILRGHLEIETDGFCLVCAGVEEQHRAVAWFADYLPGSQETGQLEVTLTYEYDVDMGSEDIRELHRLDRWVTSLSISFGDGDLEGPLSVLSHQQVSLNEDRNFWLLPKLDTVFFDRCYGNPEWILKLVRQRADPDGEHPMKARKSEPPVSKIKSLRIVGGDIMDGKTFRKVQKVVGEGAEWIARGRNWKD